jgi:hypothetical protein
MESHGSEARMLDVVKALSWRLTVGLALLIILAVLSTDAEDRILHQLDRSGCGAAAGTPFDLWERCHEERVQLPNG